MSESGIFIRAATGGGLAQQLGTQLLRGLLGGLLRGR
jgi:hypothetical protein